MSASVGGNSEVRVGIIGAGLQARRRTSVFPTKSGTKVVAVACGHPDDDKSSRELAALIGATSYSNWEDVTSIDEVDAVIVCTPPHLHAQISIAAMEAGKHVLCEKPLARTLDDAKAMVDAAKKFSVVLKCGFNHRYHPGISQAKAWVDAGIIGQLHFARCRYGICGRPGYEKEWRANPKLVGGGQLMEQGIHAVDLFRWFLGDLNQVTAFVATSYWKIEPLEDNAFVLMRSADGKLAELHSSLTHWKNTFSFDVFGHDGYVSVEGLGGSYGTERAIVGKREFDKPFLEQVVEFRGPDQSWRNEWEEFESATSGTTNLHGTGVDGVEAMRVVLAAYESSREGIAVRV